MLDQIRSLKPYQEIQNAIKVGTHNPRVGLIRSARMAVLASLCLDLNEPVLLVTDRTDRALLLLDELGFWMRDIPRFIFPEPNPMFYEQAVWGGVTRRDRLMCLSTLVQYHLPGTRKPAKPIVIVAPLRAVMTRTIPRREFILSGKTIKIGANLNPGRLQGELVKLGYEYADNVVENGQFSRRGGILDVWTPMDSYPARLEFFGEVIDTLRFFDPATQRTVSSLEQVHVTPSREFLIAGEQTSLPPGTTPDEFNIPVFHPYPATILDYLPKNSIVIVDDLSNLQSQGEEIEELSLKTRKEAVQEGTIPSDFPVPYVSWSEVVEVIQSRRWLEFTRPGEEIHPLGGRFTPGTRYGGQLKKLTADLRQFCEKGERATICSRQFSRVKEIWGDSSQDCPVDRINFLEATLGEGWELELDDGNSYHFIADGEIFGWERPKPRARVKVTHSSPESDYADLKIDDYVVHVDYGIGKFSGLVRRSLEGTEREFLQVEYDNGDQLYVPIHQVDRLMRYVGTGGELPRVSRLGGTEWSQTKQIIKGEVIKVAQDLLDLYAHRRVAQGHAFRVDTPWQQELEAGFPYTETDDQLKSVHDVKRDMESPRPMDRLLCGDVGYGKTEVALRAAFKAVMDGKQVAILVPTTVLAQQHFETFRQRLSSFPVAVEMLSRFRSPREQDEIVLKVMLGQVDIVIGTHRLLTSDVQFNDLGLVIIDEEQRFGVTHKEHFKRLRTAVDVLTLTATPIPRTLYMALTGARDISVINTPPAERLPIITHIGPYSPKIVRLAILREIERGGQVFFVHNRVQTIDAMRQHLNTLVPEARIGIAHGQMREDELSGMMVKFTQGEIDVLLCTSIIESGLDIPNANTLIVDRGDAFGLAQLYQLRGRVGRGGQRAYAYFFKHRKKAPTLEGQERLETIAENTQLGAGYSIAMRDLEMRGAGELLGTRQSGYIGMVGFHLYTKMLSQAVRQIRKATPGQDESEKAFGIQGDYIPVSVDLPMPVGIPIEYIPDQTLRLNLYRRMAHIQDISELEQLMEEFTDRFGKPVPEVINLFFQLRVKLLAARAGLSSISVEADQVVLRFPPLPEGANPRELPVIGYQTRAGKNAYWMRFDREEQNWQSNLLLVIKAIINT